MDSFARSYVGRLRAQVGSQLLHVPGTRIVIEDRQGRILMQKRSDFGRWGIPGGNVETGESSLETIVREVLEETGLRVENPRAFGFASHPEFEVITFPNGDVSHFHVLMFYTRDYRGSIGGDSGETLELGWFRPEARPDMLPNMSRSIDAYLRFKATGAFQLI